MSSAHAWLAAESVWWWPRIADHLWQATVFALLIFAATSALSRGPARFRHTLWLIASLKLLIPSTLLVLIAERAGLDLLWFMAQLHSFGGDAFPLQSISEPVSTIANSYELTVLSTNAVKHDELYCALSLFWLIGSVALLLVWLTRRRTFLQELNRGHMMREGREWELFQDAKTLLGITTRVDLILAQCQTEPTVARVWRPVVMLPESICAHLSDQELEAIMLHELVHVKRRDNLIGNLQMVVCALLWFYPLVWFISRKLINEREEACDERVLKVVGAPEAYASSILKVLRFSFGWKVAGVSGAGNGSNLRRRIKNIMSSNVTRRSPASSRIFAGLMVFLGLVLMIAAGVNTGAHGADSLSRVDKSATIYKRMISSFVPNVQRRSSSNKAQPAPPSQPIQPAQPSQPPQPPQPAQAPPAQPKPDQANQPAPPSPPAATLAPAAPPAVPTNATPATPATAPVPPTQEKIVVENVEAGQLIEAPHPVYPDEARKQQITGTVKVSIEIGEDGHVISAKATGGPAALRGAAVEAAYKARFQPTKVKGKPAKVSGALAYNFVLDDC